MSNQNNSEKLLINRENYVHGKRFFEAMRKSNKRPKESSIVTYESQWKHVILWAGPQPLSKAHLINPSLRDYVLTQKGKGVGDRMTDNDAKVLEIARKFFIWAKINLPRQYRPITQEWIEDMVPLVAQDGPTDHVYVSEDEVIAIAKFPIPWSMLPMKRAQAAHVLAFLTGARASALASLPILAVDVIGESPCIYQWPDEYHVRTKGGKKGISYLFQIPELLDVVKEWDAFVRPQLPPTAMWYTVMKSNWGEYELLPDVSGMNRAQALADDFQDLYKLVGLPYKSPNACRHGHAIYGLDHSETMAQFQAVSRNMLHSSMIITDRIYAARHEKERAAAIMQLSKQRGVQKDDELNAYLSHIGKGDIPKAISILAGRMCG